MFTRFANTRPCRAVATPLYCVSECFTKTIDSTVVCCHLKFLKAEINVKQLYIRMDVKIKLNTNLELGV